MNNFTAAGESAPTFGSTISTSSLGTYGQFGVGVAAQIVDSGWVSYLRTDYQKGDNIEGWSVNSGLRYQFVPEAAIWAREPMIAKAPIYKGPPLQTIYDWTGSISVGIWQPTGD